MRPSTTIRWALAAGAVCAVARAEPPSEDLEALVAEAQRVHEQGDYARCAELYSRVYELRPDANLLFNIGVCQFDAGDDEAAMTTLKRYLGTDPSDEARAEAERMIAHIEAEARGTPEPTPTPPAPPIDSSPAPAPASAAPPVAATPTPDSPPDPPSRSWQSTGAIVLGSVAASSLVVATVFGVAARSDWNEAKRACPDGSPCPDERGPELSRDATRNGNIATASLVVSGLALAGAVTLWLTAPSGRSKVGLGLSTHGKRPLPTVSWTGSL